jgi:dTDP-4-amino-4,6-dideoxygalactose transaminase
MLNEEEIFVTRPYLPDLKELIPYLEKIWANRILTNGGPCHRELEDALCKELGVPYVSLFANATLALIVALKARGVSGEVITTPYSFVATAHAIRLAGASPVFVDIDPVSLNLDPSKIEAAITDKTQAILPVHCYGNPCDVESIARIAENHKLSVIYDAAHAFGVECHCGSILNHGDISVLSFHATKVFNTFEGGAIVCGDLETKRKLDNLKNFGFVNEEAVTEVGLNAKMNEFSAALGLTQLKVFDLALAERQAVHCRYQEALSKVRGISIVKSTAAKANYSYFPVLVEPEFPLTRDELQLKLKGHGVNARKYFYPLISSFPMYANHTSARATNLPVARSVAERILCLPIYPGLSASQVDRIVMSMVD